MASRKKKKKKKIKFSEIPFSVSKGGFREFRPFSAIAENQWPYEGHATNKNPVKYFPLK